MRQKTLEILRLGRSLEAVSSNLRFVILVIFGAAVPISSDVIFNIGLDIVDICRYIYDKCRTL